MNRYACVRFRSTTPLNTVIMFVPQQEAWVVERMGKFNRILDPGLNVLMPFIDRVKYVQSLKEVMKKTTIEYSKTFLIKKVL